VQNIALLCCHNKGLHISQASLSSWRWIISKPELQIIRTQIQSWKVILREIKNQRLYTETTKEMPAAKHCGNCIKKKGTFCMYIGIFLSEFYVTLALLEPGSLFFWSLRSHAHNITDFTSHLFEIRLFINWWYGRIWSVGHCLPLQSLGLRFSNARTCCFHELVNYTRIQK
jgi:hypothetical protein